MAGMDGGADGDRNGEGGKESEMKWAEESGRDGKKRRK